MAKILIVDDDADVRGLLSDALKSAGHKIVTARDGVEGFEAFHRDIFDMAIIDVDMPRKNGIDLCKDIREENENFPIVLITAYAHLYDAQEVLMLGVEAFLKKPVDIDYVRTLVDQIKGTA